MSDNIEHTGTKPLLLIVGPLPPPYIGPAVATERLTASPVLHDAFRLELLNTGDPEGEKDIGRLTLHNIGQALGQLAGFWWRLLTRRPDVVYISIARGLWGFLRDTLLIVPARVMGAAVLVHLRAGHFDLIHDCGAAGRMLARIGLGSVRRALVLGETTRGIFGSYVPADRVRVVPNGMNLEGWPPPVPRSAEPAGFHIVYLANLFRDKGTHVMLAALPDIIAQVPDVLVSFAGEWQDLAYRDECMRFIEQHGLAPHVRFIGVVSGAKKRALLDSADLVVFVPVAPEGSPWVVLEAMACGRAVIGTPQGTMRETIEDGRTGVLVPVNDPAALAATVVRLVNDSVLRAAMGNRGRERVETVYSETHTHALLAAVANEVVRGRQNSKGKIQK